MSDSIVERAARTLCEMKMLDPDQKVEVKVGRGTARWIALWESEAPVVRAVLASIREPTEAMEIAGVLPAMARDPVRTYQAMIDAALAEKK